MPTPHSSVVYVEPNSFEGNSIYDWSITSDNKEYDRIIDPEDYCIGLTITTELCNRGQELTDESRFITLKWDNNVSKNDGDTTTSTVNFMSGRLVKTVPTKSASEYSEIPFLTTEYADMYVTDLKNYGTTEMVGIKSVNIDFENAVLPVITIRFTDVRGMSLFTPSEFSRLDTLRNDNTVSAEEAAKAFFQCFFRFPYPKFNITVKGFYGRAVTYEVTCDKFETTFNSDTGNFDVMARFIGYKYSFLSDISIDLLYTAPYCEFLGEKYWNEKKASGDFVIRDINGNLKEMPTLVEIRNTIKTILSSASTQNEETTLTREEDGHEDERRQLEQIKTVYNAWYEQFVKEVNAKFGKDYCFVNIDNSTNEYTRILILTNKGEGVNNLSQDGVQFSNDMLKVNNDLLALIKKYNESYGSGNKLDEFNSDFSSFVKKQVFNEVIKTKDNYFQFKGYRENCDIKDIAKQMIIQRISDNITDEQSLGGNERMQKSLKTIYGDGTNQYLYCYDVNLDYSNIQRRIDKLTLDSNESYAKKRRNKRIHEENIRLINELGFNPTISNITKIVMAHLETLMHMIYTVTNAIKAENKRTPSSIGISVGKEGTLSDIRDKDSDLLIPPFPRVTKTVYESDGSKRQEDMWIGELDNDVFQEVDLVETFFNAIEKVRQVIEEANREIEENQNNGENNANNCVVKYPLTSFDFFLTSKVYGDDVTDSIEKLAGSVAIRMFDIFSINFFANQFNGTWLGNTNFASTLGRAEAHNFYYSVNTSKNKDLKEWIKLDTGQFNADKVLDIISSSNGEYPWSLDKSSRTPKPLITKNDRWLFRYQLGNKHGNSFMYPVQNISFDAINETFSLFKSPNENFENKDIILSCPSKFNKDTITYLKDTNVHYSLIIEDDYNKIKTIMDSSMAESVSAYTEVSNMILSACSLDNAIEKYYKEFIKTEGSTSFCKKQNIKKKTDNVVFYNADASYDKTLKVFSDKGFFVSEKTDSSKEIEYSCEEEGLNEYFTSEISNKNINSCFISEISVNSVEMKYVNYGLTPTTQTTTQTPVRVKKSITHKESFSPIELLMGIDCLNYNAISNKCFNSNVVNAETFNFIPRLMILQLGAVLNETENLDQYISIDDVEKKNGILFNNDFKKLTSSYLNKIGIYSRLTILKYFKNWVDKDFNNILNNLKKGKNQKHVAVTFTNRALLYEGSPFIKELTNMLMLPILVINGNVCHSARNDNNYMRPISHNRYVTKDGIFKSYLNGFIDELNKLMQVDYTVDSSGNMVRRTKDASNTTDDMRMELYRYLKQIYDKWIPSAKESDWNYKNFFNDLADKESNNYKFYFIDSYYNKIDDKLLVNPQTLMDRLEGVFNNPDISASVYLLLGWVYQDNRCMFKCIQNFMDLSDVNSMKEMFKPLPYSEAMSNKRKGSDFVIVYTYEPSKYLNVNSSEFEDDGFMLNDETYTPLSIKTRGGNGNFYKIPAFGVTYGKQYQSYFKNISVDTKNTIQTQQAIMAKHQILLGKTDKNKYGTAAQDLFDLYTTQSYTCKVEMMGCAWVQPMMYFVLLNVPMFRGSYMIMKVNHSITPGNMTTTFTGCRMANAANKFVEDIFIPNDGEEDGNIGDESVTYNEAHANVDNDCPYKVYPLFDIDGGSIGSFNGDEKGPIFSSKKAWAIAMFHAWISRGVKQEIAKVIVAQEGLECGWGSSHCADFNYGGFKPGGVCKNFNSIEEFVDYGIKHVYCNFPGALQAKTWREYFNIIQNINNANPKGMSYCVTQTVKGVTYHCEGDEYTVQIMGKDGNGGTYKIAKEYLEGVSTVPDNINQENNTETKMNEEIYEKFFSSVQSTANNTDSMMFSLKREYYPNKDYKDKTMMISASDDKDTPKLTKLFDCILNTREYFKYVTTLYFVYTNDTKTISRVDVKLSPKEVAVNNQRVWLYKSGTRGNDPNNTVTYNKLNVDDLNDEIKKSFGKTYQSLGNDGQKFKTLVQQIRDPENLSGFTPMACASVGTSFDGGGGSNGSATMEGYNGEIRNSLMRRILDIDNNGKALDYIKSENYAKKFEKKFGYFPEHDNALGDKIYKGKRTNKKGESKYTYCGCCTSGPVTWYGRVGIKLLWWTLESITTSNYKTTKANMNKANFVCVWHGTRDKAKALSNSELRPGDICTIHVDGSSHGAMWTGKDWRSDAIQERLWIYGGKNGRGGDYSVCIWRNPKCQEEGMSVIEMA